MGLRERRGVWTEQSRAGAEVKGETSISQSSDTEEQQSLISEPPHISLRVVCHGGGLRDTNKQTDRHLQRCVWRGSQLLCVKQWVWVTIRWDDWNDAIDCETHTTCYTIKRSFCWHKQCWITASSETRGRAVFLSIYARQFIFGTSATVQLPATGPTKGKHRL